MFFCGLCSVHICSVMRFVRGKRKIFPSAKRFFSAMSMTAFCVTGLHEIRCATVI